MRVQVDEEKTAMVSSEGESEDIKWVETENAKELGSKNSEEVERRVKKEDIVETILTSFRAAKPKGRTAGRDANVCS